jgi:hypothetical protein
LAASIRLKTSPFHSGAFVKTLSALLLLNKRTGELIAVAVNPVRIYRAEEEKEPVSFFGSYCVLSCVAYQWMCFLFFSSVS